MLTYVRRGKGFKRKGEVRSRYVYVQVQGPDGQWSDPLVPLPRTQIVALIEQEIATGARHLRGVAYRLTEVASKLSDSDRQRLQAIKDKRRER